LIRSPKDQFGCQTEIDEFVLDQGIADIIEKIGFVNKQVSA
jgi:hypothetical protein